MAEARDLFALSVARVTRHSRRRLPRTTPEPRASLMAEADNLSGELDARTSHSFLAALVAIAKILVNPAMRAVAAKRIAGKLTKRSHPTRTSLAPDPLIRWPTSGCQGRGKRICVADQSARTSTKCCRKTGAAAMRKTGPTPQNTATLVERTSVTTGVPAATKRVIWPPNSTSTDAREEQSATAAAGTERAWRRPKTKGGAKDASDWNTAQLGLRLPGSVSLRAMYAVVRRGGSEQGA